MAKTSTERGREFRQRKRVQQASTAKGLDRQPTKSGAQRTREWRARKKGLRNAADADPELLSQIESTIAPGPPRIPIIIDANTGDGNSKYTDFKAHRSAHQEFRKKFYDNPFGHECDICSRLWFKNDLKETSDTHQTLLQTEFPGVDTKNFKACSTCMSSLTKNRVPIFSTSNGFKYPEKPPHLPPLDLVSERLISPRIPFMQIRRLRHMNGQYGIFGQVINVPVDVNTMVNALPRSISDDHCINVHIKRKQIHKSSYLAGLINKATIKSWLQFLCATPLYIFHNIVIDHSFFDGRQPERVLLDEISEDIPIEDSLTAQQQTLLWNEEKYIRLAPGEKNVPNSLLFDEHAEELSFPSIYLGQFRVFKEGVRVTSYSMATSELRRADRRGVTPQHLLYLAMKIMRLRVRDSLTIAFKHIGNDSNITKEQIQSEAYINQSLETNLAFLKCIPNSGWYWAERKRDLFAMIRQLGRPTIFLTLSANEIGWVNLLKTLYKLKNETELSDEMAAELTYIQKSTLINEDAVTCSIYFNKLVNVLMTLLQSKKSNPFGEYRVINYFKRIEFQHRGSPHAHILLWLENAPDDAVGADRGDAIAMIDKLISVSPKESSGNINLQTHKHTFTCYKNVRAGGIKKCRFEAPFLPSKRTIIVIPMQKTDPNFAKYAMQYKNIRNDFENNDYDDLEAFYRANDITSDEHYLNILQAGIIRPRVFLKRKPSEKWNNPFNPFVLNVLKSNTDMQFILEEYSCAAYVVEYINKTNRGISNLQRRITETMDQHPEFDIVEITRKMSIDMLNTVEMSSQEAAWYLLREPMSRASTVVVFIPTVWPVERQRIRKTRDEMERMGLTDDATNIWKENWFDKYQRRPEYLEEVTLAQFVANYTIQGERFTKRKNARVIRFRNYDMTQDLNEYKREMVTLHLPFRDEETEILADLKFVKLYNDHEELILKRRREFETNLNLLETIELYKKLCREEENLNDGDPLHVPADRQPEPDPLQELYNADVNRDIRDAAVDKLGVIAKKRENLMPTERFVGLMRMTNQKQHELLVHVIHNILTENRKPLQIFVTGPAGCGKTFAIKLIMDIYNRFSYTDGYYNAYITCASTGKAAVEIDGVTVHTALSISPGKKRSLSDEVRQQYQSLFRYVQVLIIDEVSMVSAEMLFQIDDRLKTITGNFNTNFGGIDIIMIGDLRQLPPVRATPIYKQSKLQRMVGPTLWHGLKYFAFDEVMRQADREFSGILTKIGDGSVLSAEELNLIESRFVSKDEADRLCPFGVRLFYSNQSVELHNKSRLNLEENKIISVATDVLIGCQGAQQTAFVRQEYHKKSIIDTGGLPYEIIFVSGKFYMLTTNIDVSDGLANGAMGKLVHIELSEANEVTRVWMEFPNSPKAGEKTKRKLSAYVHANNISRAAVPIGRRTSTTYMNNNKTIAVKRNHFPIISCCAVTIHKSQGGTFDEVVYEYSKSHPQSLLYVALSRVTSINGLYIVSPTDDHCFYHGRSRCTTMGVLQAEFRRLAENQLVTIGNQLNDFMEIRKGLSVFTLNCQSLKAHACDLNDSIAQNSTILVLSETWANTEDRVDVPNFDCIVKFKRRDRRAGGVAIYHKSSDKTVAMTPHLSISIAQMDSISLNTSSVGEVCATRCKVETGQIILIVAVYISPNQKLSDIMGFIHEALIVYTPEVAATLRKNWGELPMIMSGDFNVNLAKPEAQPLIDFLQDKFQLTLNSDRMISTTRSGTTIDAVFCRYLDGLKSRTYITYFSYHKPLVSVIDFDESMVKSG